MMRFIRSSLLVGLVAAPVLGQSSDPSWRIRKAPWPQAVLDAAARLPVQRAGRIKPLNTFAGFDMLRLNGKRSLTTPWGETLTPVAWILDCLFFPEQARQYKTVLIDDSRVVEAIGVEVDRKNRRDRYSMAELEGSLRELHRQGEEFKKLTAGARSRVQQQIILISERLPSLGFLLDMLNFARERYATAGLPGFAAAFPNQQEVGFLDMATRFAKLRQGLLSPPEAQKKTVEAFFDSLSLATDRARYMSFLPPGNPAEETYLAASDVLMPMLQYGSIDEQQMPTLRRLEQLAAVRTDFDKFTPLFLELSKDLTERARARGEFGKIDLEVGFYQSDWFSRGQYGFLLAFLCCAFLWLRPRVRPVYWLGWLSILSAETMLIIGIVIRCMIRGRPPITTPYEAILAITAAGVLIMMFVEWLRRSVLSLSLAGLAGGLGILLANWHEGLEGTDTMAPLVAVLDTNFWLATHVTVVTMGYCAGVLAALIAHVYIFGKLFRYRYGDKKFYADLTRITYGVLCFGVLFSTVGTILGGVWANDSWGRFWGWDPKENGALMLVLGFLAVLHARMGGYIREFGIALSSIVIGIIVVWAFLGVNLIGVGLHSYGFSEKMKLATDTYYLTQTGVLGLGILAWFLERRIKATTSG